MMQARSPGRPRDEDASRAILEAAFRQLRECGYTAMTMESVAAAAGVAKTTVYRRYEHKADLASAALASQIPVPESVDTGRVRDDLVLLASRFEDVAIGGIGVTMLGALLVQEDAHPELMTLFRERVIEPRRRLMADVLRRGIDSGDLSPDLDEDQVIDLLAGAILMRRIGKGTLPAGYAASLVDALWPAIAS